jgi:hypothetical protein
VIEWQAIKTPDVTTAASHLKQKYFQLDSCNAKLYDASKIRIPGFLALDGQKNIMTGRRAWDDRRYDRYKRLFKTVNIQTIS